MTSNPMPSVSLGLRTLCNCQTSQTRTRDKIAATLEPVKSTKTLQLKGFVARLSVLSVGYDASHSLRDRLCLFAAEPKRHYDLSSVTHLLCWGSPHIRNTICDRTKTIYNKRLRLGIPQNKGKRTTLFTLTGCGLVSVADE